MPIDIKTLSEEIAPYVASAADYIFNSYKMDLDLSLESLAVIDHYLAKARPVEPAVLDLLAAAMGAYFGEALRRKMHGTWDFSAGKEPAQWVLDLPQGVTISPVGMVAQALAMEEVSGYDGSIYVPDDKVTILRRVLKSQPPVSPERYYAISTRIEVIEKVTEALAAAEKTSHDQLADSKKKPH